MRLLSSRTSMRRKPKPFDLSVTLNAVRACKMALAASSVAISRASSRIGSSSHSVTVWSTNRRTTLTSAASLSISMHASSTGASPVTDIL